MFSIWKAVALLSAIAAIGGSYLGAYSMGDKAGYTRRDNEILQEDSKKKTDLLNKVGDYLTVYDKLLQDPGDFKDGPVSPAVGRTLGGLRGIDKAAGRDKVP